MKACAPLPGKDTRLAREQVRRDRMDQEHGIVGKELMNWPSGKRDDGGKKGGGSNGSKPDWHGDKQTSKKARAMAKARVKPDTATTAESKGTSE